MPFLHPTRLSTWAVHSADPHFVSTCWPPLTHAASDDLLLHLRGLGLVQRVQACPLPDTPLARRFMNMGWLQAPLLLASCLLTPSTHDSTRPPSQPAHASSRHGHPVVRGTTSRYNRCFLIACPILHSLWLLTGPVIHIVTRQSARCNLAPSSKSPCHCTASSSCPPPRTDHVNWSHQHLDQPRQVCLRPIMLHHSCAGVDVLHLGTVLQRHLRPFTWLNRFLICQRLALRKKTFQTAVEITNNVVLVETDEGLGADSGNSSGS